MIINLPQKIMIDKEVDLNTFFQELNLGKKCLVVCDDTARNIVGHKLESALEFFDFKFDKAESLEKSDLEKFSKLVENYDFTIGVGGGRSIDMAKYSSFLAKKPWISFPTILSHDGVVSSRASISENKVRISVDSAEPSGIIIDLDTIKKSPYRYTASGAGDSISNLSSVEDWKIADKAGKEKYHDVMGQLSLISANSVIANVKDIKEKTYHGLEVLAWSLISSGFAMNIYGSSRPGSGSEHNFSHMLDEMDAGKLHGEQVALGTIITTYLQKGDWEKIRSIIKNLGLPTTSEEIGLDKDILIDALVKAKDVRDRYTILNEINLDKNTASTILTELEIIS